MVHVNGTGYKTVHKGTFPATDIQVDWLGGNVYWTERDSNYLRCVTLDGQYSKSITSTSHPPTFLLLDPPKRFLSFVCFPLKRTSILLSLSTIRY